MKRIEYIGVVGWGVVVGWGGGGGTEEDEEDRINRFRALTSWYENIYIYIYICIYIYIWDISLGARRLPIDILRKFRPVEHFF